MAATSDIISVIRRISTSALSRPERRFNEPPSNINVTNEIDEISPGEIENDMQNIKTSLQNVNPFLKRLAASHSEVVVMLEITAGGESTYNHMSYRDLYDNIRKQTALIDSTFSFDRNRGDNPNADATLNSAAIDLRVRDLRWLEQQEPTILVRRHVTMITLDPIRAIVMADKMILIVPVGADSLLGIIENHMREWSPEILFDGSNVSIPFELHAYEAILTTVKVLQSKELDRVSANAHELLTYFKKGSLLPVSLQEEMRELKNIASRIAVKLSMYRHALDELIDNDDDMALMNLTKLRENPALYCSPLSHEIRAAHEEVEELLQAYAMDYNTLGAKLEHLRNQIQNAEDLISLRLDTSRNELLVANTAFALLACCTGLGAYLSGIFGMNLDNTVTIQPVYGVFAIVWAGSTFAMISLFVVVYTYLNSTGILPRRISTSGRKQKRH